MARAALVAGWRTPFLRAGTDFAQLDVLDLARAATVELFQRSGLDPQPGRPRHLRQRRPAGAVHQSRPRAGAGGRFAQVHAGRHGHPGLRLGLPRRSPTPRT